jgi:hypothetical protein
MVPCWTVPIAKTGQHILPIILQDSMDSNDESAAFLNLDMMETAHVKNKIKHAAAEG